MNAVQRFLYSAKHIRRMKLFESEFVRRVYNALVDQLRPVIRALRHDGPLVALQMVDHVIINEHIAPVILDIYKKVGLYFANKTIHDLRMSVREQKGFGFNEEFIRAILQFFASFLLDKAVLPITQTTKDQIRAVLNQGITEGWGVDRMAQQLESPELLLWRARMIVRTESNKAMNEGSRLAEEKSRVETEKTWIAANDHRTRHSHRMVDDKTIDFKAYFKVGIIRRGAIIGYDYMIGPGDVHATAGNVINCRCVLSFKGKRDARGRLIRKKIQPLEEVVKSINYDDMTPEECLEIMAEVKSQILTETKNEIIIRTERIRDEFVMFKDVVNSGITTTTQEVKTGFDDSGNQLALLINDTEAKQLESVERVINLIQSKNYTPEINLQTDSKEVKEQVSEMRRELIDLLTELRDQMLKKKTWVHTIERDKNDLISKIISKQQ